MTGKTGPGRMPPKLDTFLDYIRKRAEKPDLDAVIVLAAGEAGFELVGPGEKVRSLNLDHRAYDVLSACFRSKWEARSCSRCWLTVRRRATWKRQAASPQAFFSLEPTSGKVTALGEVPLPDQHPCPWSAGGNKIAVLRKAADGGREIVIYAR